MKRKTEKQMATTANATNAETQQVGNENGDTAIGVSFDAAKAALDGELSALAEDLRTTVLKSGAVLRVEGDTDSQAKELAELQARLRVIGAKVNGAIVRGHKVLIAAADADSQALTARRKEVEAQRNSERAKGLERLAGKMVDANGQQTTTTKADKLLTDALLFTSPVEAALHGRGQVLLSRDMARSREALNRRREGPTPKSITLPDGAGCKAWLEGATVHQILVHSDALVSLALGRPDVF